MRLAIVFTALAISARGGDNTLTLNTGDSAATCADTNRSTEIRPVGWLSPFVPGY